MYLLLYLTIIFVTVVLCAIMLKCCQNFLLNMLLHGFWVLFDFSILPGTESKEPIPNWVGSMFFEEPIGTGFLRTKLLQKLKNRSVRFGRTERLGLLMHPFARMKGLSRAVLSSLDGARCSVSFNGLVQVKP